MYLATTTMAFPEVEWQMRMPPLAGAICGRDGTVQISPFQKSARLLPLGPYPSSHAVMERVAMAFSEKNPLHKPELDRAIDSLWPQDSLRERSVVIYELLASLHREGKISFIQERIPGVLAGETAPRTFIEYKDS